jgi:hypothetical protein
MRAISYLPISDSVFTWRESLLNLLHRRIYGNALIYILVTLNKSIVTPFHCYGWRYFFTVTHQSRLFSLLFAELLLLSCNYGILIYHITLQIQYWRRFVERMVCKLVLCFSSLNFFFKVWYLRLILSLVCLSIVWIQKQATGGLREPFKVQGHILDLQGETEVMRVFLFTVYKMKSCLETRFVLPVRSVTQIRGCRLCDRTPDPGMRFVKESM